MKKEDALESELAMFRGVVEALAKSNPWFLLTDGAPDATCKHCMVTIDVLDDSHDDGCIWAAAVVALEVTT